MTKNTHVPSLGCGVHGVVMLRCVYLLVVCAATTAVPSGKNNKHPTVAKFKRNLKQNNQNHDVTRFRTF